MYESWGDKTSRQAFVQYPENTFPGQTKKLENNTHFNSFGANEIIKCVVQGIKILNLGLVHYLKPNISEYNPKQPDLISNSTLPLSPRFATKKLMVINFIEKGIIQIIMIPQDGSIRITLYIY